MEVGYEVVREAGEAVEFVENVEGRSSCTVCGLFLGGCVKEGLEGVELCLELWWDWLGQAYPEEVGQRSKQTFKRSLLSTSIVPGLLGLGRALGDGEQVKLSGRGRELEWGKRGLHRCVLDMFASGGQVGVAYVLF